MPGSRRTAQRRQSQKASSTPTDTPAGPRTLTSTHTIMHTRFTNTFYTSSHVPSTPVVPRLWQGSQPNPTPGLGSAV